MGIFRSLQKLNNAFFDGLKENTTKRILAEANKEGPSKDALEIIDTIKKDEEYIDKLLEDASKP